MSRLLRTRDKKLFPPVALSLICHLIFFAFFTRVHVFGPVRVSEPVCYVNIVDLPVASPQGGAPAAPRTAQPAIPPSPPTAMKLPVPAAPARLQLPKAAAPSPKEPPPAKESAEDFEERLRRLQRQADARHQSAALEAMQRKVAAAAGKAGMPGMTGKEAGSDYGSYIRSRLEDAFRQEDTFKPDRAKVMAIRLFLNKSGRIASVRVEQSSPDKVFNEAVMRAISRAEKEFKPPPGGGELELKFIFMPQEVSRK